MGAKGPTAGRKPGGAREADRPSALMVCDPIDSLSVAGDTTVALAHSLQGKGWSVHSVAPHNLWLDGKRAYGRVRELRNAHPRQEIPTERAHLGLGEERATALDSFDMALMRVDPPVDGRYIKLTWLLDFLNEATPVLNPPAALRSLGEKLSTLHFDAAVPTLISSDKQELASFARSHGRVIIKPVNGLGGRGVYLFEDQDTNINVLLDDRLGDETLLIAQAYLPAIESEGDLRVMLIDGEPLDKGLARLPRADEHRGNLGTGSSTQLRALSAAQLRIGKEVGRWCRQHRIPFAGLDIIGESLTEINITSPTGVRQMENLGFAGISDKITSAIISYAREADAGGAAE